MFLITALVNRLKDVGRFLLKIVFGSCLLLIVAGINIYNLFQTDENRIQYSFARNTNK